MATTAVWVGVYASLPVDRLLEWRPDGSRLDLIRSHHTTVPFHKAWASEGWRWGTLPLQAAPFVVALLAVLLGWRARPFDNDTLPRAYIWGAGATLCAVSALGFWWGRVFIPISLTYGDTPALIRQIAQGTWVFPAEPLMMHLFNGISHLLRNLRGAPDGVLAGQLTAILCGVLYVAALWSLAVERVGHRAGAVLLWTALALTGTATQFFGTIETTLLQTAGIAAFLASAAWTLRTATPLPHAAAVASLHVALGVVLCAHAAGVALLPAFVSVWVVLLRRARRAARLRSLCGLPAIGSLVLGTLLPWLAVVWWPFYRQGSFGNSAGGGDHFRFVPWDIETARQTSDYVYYGMVSRLHAIDFANGLVLAAPFALALVAVAFGIRRQLGARWQSHTDAQHAMLLLAAVGCMSVVALWDFDFGMWGDWNIVACYLLPLHVYSWVVAHDALQQTSHARAWHLTLLVPLVLAQVALGLGMWLQFHPPGLG